MAGKGSDESPVMELIKEAEEMKQNLVSCWRWSMEQPPAKDSIPSLLSGAEDVFLACDAPTHLSPWFRQS